MNILEWIQLFPSQKKFKGKPISRNGSFAFYGNKSIISVTFDKNIQTLGGLSLGNFTSLKSISFLSGGL